ncbi:LLM class flavin-dependent oxidoreductase [Salegentibacter sp.]|uniref:LLM class flavin-dependent oxidoreductase n=1 Tax=Salegentibacter sp. TaxID=1903072 RepID=UPI00356AF2F1
MEKIKLSILDQSIVRTGNTAQEALQETITTAKLADKLGYHRFWLSEHHNSKFIAGSAPEVILSRLGAETKNIRLGSGGIMLPNHSAFKVAENFRTLEALYPNRIDLGMGRAPGGDRVSAYLLNPSNTFKEEDYLTQLEHLQHFFTDTAGTEKGKIYAIPQVNSIPQQWILSSSGGSAKIAAEMGMGLSVAKFINGLVSPEVVREYRKLFRASETLKSPKAFVSVFLMCGETEEIAANMRKYIEYILLQFERGNFQNYPEFSEIEKYEFNEGEKELLQRNAGRIVSGTKESVKEQLQQLAADFEVDEVMISTMSYSKELRLRSFELVAQAFDLKPEA